MANPLNDFGLKIFLDRYAQKDTTKATLAVDDLVVVCVNQKTRQREVGNVVELLDNPGNKPRVRIKLLDGSEVTQDWDDVDKPTETTPEQTMARTARGIAGQESEEKRAEWEEKFKWLLDEWRFVPGGRILSAAGTEQNLTYFNCFSRETLVHLDTGVVEIGTLNGTYNVLSQGGVYRPAKFKSYGVQQLWEVTLENGAVMHATEEHQWVVSKPKGGDERVYTREITGRMIPVNPRAKPEIDADYYAGVRNGIVYGDGTLANTGKSANVYLFGEKMDLETYFDGFGTSHTHAEATESYPEHIRILGLDAALKSLPSEDASASYWRGFVAGLLATDGNVDDRGSCSLFSASENDLRYIADNMAKAGYVHASIKMTRSASPFDGSYKPVFTLRLFKWCIVEEDLLRQSARSKFEASPDRKTATIRVVSAVPTDRVEEVFCCNEEDTHTLTVGHGYLTGNCYVVPSPKDSRTGIVETLSSMMEIMSRGGGVGINLSSLRPRHNYVKGVNGRSSGSISWGGLYSFVTGLIEQGGCFAPYTRILTDRGNIPVLEIVEGMERGEKYQAWTHKGWRAVTDRFRNGRKTVYRLTTDQGYTLDITGEHKVMTMDGAGTFGLVKLDKLSAGDSVMILRGSTPNDLPYVKLTTDVPKDVQGQDVRLPAELDEDFAYVLGYYVGNGHITKSSERAPHTIAFAVPHDRPATLQLLTETLERLFGRRVSQLDGDGAVTRVAVCSRQLVRYFDANDMTKDGSLNACAPEQIFRSRRSVIEAFVGGWFAADGCNRGAKGGFGIDTVSYQGAMDMQKLLQMLGIVSRIATQTREAQGWNTIYRVVVSGSYMCSEMAKWLGDYTDKVSDLPLPVKNHAYTWPVNFNKTYRPSFTAKFDRIMPPWNGTTSQAAIAHVRDNTELLTEEQAEHFQMLDNCVHDTIASIEKIGVMDTYDLTVDEVHTMSGDGIYVSNSRRGALMLILNLDHPDVLDFIDAKREAGKITNANISVAIPDAFMDAVRDDGDWNLVFPDTTHEAYDAEWNGDLKAWRAKGYPVVTHKTVRARELWRKIASSAWASAEPGILFIDRVNAMSNSHYFSPLICTNPCFPGDTRVHTSRGLVKASELYASQENLNLVSDSRFGNAETLVPSTPVFLTAKSAQLHKITTVEGYEVRATEDHRFMTTEGWKHLKDLCEGDKIHIVNRGTHIHSTDEEGDAALGRILGWLVGDGFMHAASGVVLSFYGDKRDLVPAFQQDVHTVIGADLSPVTGHETELRLASTRLASKVAGFGITSTEDKVQVPELVFSGSTATQRGFLQALFSSDGTVADSENGTRSVRLSASKLEFLRDVQLLLLNFGVYSKIYKDRHEAGYRKLPDGNGGLSSYFCQATHDLVVSKADIRTFYEAVGFLPGSSKQKQLRLLVGCYTFYKSNFLARVESVLPDGVEDVYDVTEPLNHSVVINGFVSHNCGEQPLPAWGICNLGAINLGVHVDDNGKVKWDELKQTVRYAVRFLDNVIDATPYFIDENKKQQQNERRVGLGIMGLAEMLVKCGVRYGSKAGVEFVDELGKFIATEAYIASSDYAAEKGAFPAFDADKLLDSGFMKGMPKSVRSLVKKQGLRNVTLLTVAPTGTTGTMVDTSTGVEPYFSWTYWRKSRLGMNEIEVDIVKDWRKANPEAKDLPDYFVTAMELSPEEHVVMQGALQRWIDSALSKTCNAPNNYTVDDVQKLYELMYRLGCKGGTIYRDGSRDEQVLMTKAEPVAAAAAQAPDIDAEARKLGYVKIEDAVANPDVIAKILASVGVQAAPEPVSRRRKDKVMQSINCKQQTHLGSCYTDVTYDRNNDPLEIFVRSGKAGSDVASLAEGLGRLASTLLTMPSPVPPMERLRDIAGHLEGIGGSDSVGFGRAQIKSMPDAVGKSLLIIADELDTRKGKVTAAEPEEKVDEAKPVRKSKKAAADICPSCGGATYIREEGCKHCTSCGHSACG